MLVMRSWAPKCSLSVKGEKKELQTWLIHKGLFILCGLCPRCTRSSLLILLQLCQSSRRWSTRSPANPRLWSLSPTSTQTQNISSASSPSTTMASVSQVCLLSLCYTQFWWVHRGFLGDLFGGVTTVAGTVRKDRCTLGVVWHHLFSSVQDGIYALGKAHMRSTPSLRSFPNLAFETVPVFNWLTMALSCPFKEDCPALIHIIHNGAADNGPAQERVVSNHNWSLVMGLFQLDYQQNLQNWSVQCTRHHFPKMNAVDQLTQFFPAVRLGNEMKMKSRLLSFLLFVFAVSVGVLFLVSWSSTFE